MARDTVSLKFTGDIAKQLRRFASDVQEKALRPAAYAGAKLLYDEMHVRVPVKDGLLKSALYHWYNDKKSTDNEKIYAIGVNMKKAPHWHLLEYGHMRTHKVYQGKDGRWFSLKAKPLPTPVQVAAKPYIRPAFDSRISAALDAAKKRMGEKVQELMQ